MREHPDPVRLIVQLSAIALLLATVALSVGSLSNLPVAREHSSGEQQANTNGQELTRCRTMTPEQLSLDDGCQRAWARNRQRFLGQDQEVGRALDTEIPTTSAQPSPDNSRAVAGHGTSAAAQRE